MRTTIFQYKLVFLLLCQITTISLIMAKSGETPDKNSINMNYLGSVEGKSFFAERTPTRNWTEAKLYCKQSGMHLASLSTTVQRTLIQNSYNSATFHGVYWTGGRDARAPSQFVWDFTGDALDNNITLVVIAGIKTCVDWDQVSASNGHLDSDPCASKYGVLCEINSG